MIYNPGVMQLLLINVRAPGDGDAVLLPLWSPEHGFMGMMAAAY